MNASNTEIIDLLVSSLELVSYVLEMRDPYTAGHQMRVADLSVEIGKELGLSQYQLQGIHLAATVHDIGKIKTPSEILVKPGRLDDLEFQLIQRHCETGFNLLNRIDYPWPVADVAFQHHERIDGSGYPRGLKGDEIIYEAQIVAIADIIESMTSHRPYRPMLGITRTLEELDRMKGIQLDKQLCEIGETLLTKSKFLIDFTKK